MPDICYLRSATSRRPRRAARSAAVAGMARPDGWAALLERVYLRMGLSAPILKQVRPEAIPHPYRALLVHSSDMTPTLENFFQQSLGLTVLSRDEDANSYTREVLLHVGPGPQPVLYGMIRIFLNHLPAEARRRVLEEQHPLGHILQTEAVAHLSWPRPFFRLAPDQRMAGMLRVIEPAELYGRRNVLVDGSRRLLAEVIEILAPIDRPWPDDPGECRRDSGPNRASRSPQDPIKRTPSALPINEYPL